MMHTTLLIMAAGMGSRFGGNKQIARMGPHGEILLEYSIHDAVAAGFDKVVFVIKRSMEADFRRLVGDRIAGKVQVCYAFQEFDSLPGGFVPPEGRVKPYGTVHAVLAAKDVIREPFAVLNADDFYGREAFFLMAENLRALQGRNNAAAMVAYRLCNTVSENGHVTRGLCEVDGDGCLLSVTETYRIRPFPDGTIRDVNFREEGDVLAPQALASMNFWGLTPWFFTVAERDLTAFLADGSGDPMKKEYVLPTAIDRLMRTDGLRVRVTPTAGSWFGVTYQEDRPVVEAALRRLHAEGVYPDAL
ncbi:MAG: NTP transferase domain-containing protein [Clostridia bacterium]|nr:NTP transferase domain-containing protein [Clostridia bacterium]